MSYERIPKDPRDNVARLESIVVGYKRKLASKKNIRSLTESKLTRLRETLLTLQDDEEKQEKLTVERKYLFDLNNLDTVIAQLEGKIIWAERRQIPFLMSEIERLYVEKSEENAAE